MSLSALESDNDRTVSAAIRDITERKRLEAASTLENDRLVSAVESIHDAFALFDNSDRLILYNSMPAPDRRCLAGCARGLVHQELRAARRLDERIRLRFRRVALELSAKSSLPCVIVIVAGVETTGREADSRFHSPTQPDTPGRFADDTFRPSDPTASAAAFPDSQNIGVAARRDLIAESARDAHEYLSRGEPSPSFASFRYFPVATRNKARGSHQT